MKYIELAKAPTLLGLRVLFYFAILLGFKDEAVQIALQASTSEANVEMFSASGENTSTQPKNEENKKKKKKKKKKKQPPCGSTHQQVAASSSHPKEIEKEQRTIAASASSMTKKSDMVLASSSHPMQFDDHDEEDMYIGIHHDHDEEDLYIGKHLDMNKHIKIWVDFQDENEMFHGKMHITSKHIRDVSFIPLSNEETNLDLFDFLYDFVDDFTLKVFVLLEHPRHSYIVAEHVSFAHSFFKREQGISPTFKKIFRIIMQEFIVLIRKGKSIGDFRRCAFVTTKGVEGRVLPSLSLDLEKDLHSYHNFFIESLEHHGIPKILEPYLKELKSISSLQ